MPDQNEASVEHALIREIAEPLETLPDDPVAIAADVPFPVVLRGYDRIAVDAYVKRVNRAIAEVKITIFGIKTKIVSLVCKTPDVLSVTWKGLRATGSGRLSPS